MNIKHIIILFALTITTNVNAWDTVKSVDPITDEVSYTAFHNATYARSEVYATCSDELLVVAIYYNDFNYFKGQTPITYRVDKNDPVDFVGYGDSTYLGLTLHAGDNYDLGNRFSAKLIKQMMAGNYLVVRADTAFNGRVTKKFTLSGFTKAITKACGNNLIYKKYINGK